MASRGKTTQLDHMYVADFETCDAWEAKTDNIPDQRVWLAGLMNLQTGEFEYYTELDDFMRRILSRGDNCNTEIGFHNLKFDGSYIVPWLLTNGYFVTQNKPVAGEFSVLIDERNAWYQLTIQVTHKRRVTIWDTLKLFPTALEYLHNQYATPTRKIHESQEFYDRIRPPGYEPELDELKYLRNDLKVLQETLLAHIDFYGLRFKKTQASQSFYNFEQHFKCWKLRFPALDVEVDEVVRPAYWGGF